MVPAVPRWGAFNLGDRVDQGNLAFLVEAFAATNRGGGIGVAAAVAPRLQLSGSASASRPRACSRSARCHGVEAIQWRSVARPPRGNQSVCRASGLHEMGR